MATFNTSIFEGDEERSIVVEYTYHRGYRGARDSLCGIRNAGPPLEPDEDPYYEIESVTDAVTGEDIDLTLDEQGIILDKLANNE